MITLVISHTPRDGSVNQGDELERHAAVFAPSIQISGHVIHHTITFSFSMRTITGMYFTDAFMVLYLLSGHSHIPPSPLHSPVSPSDHSSLSWPTAFNISSLSANIKSYFQTERLGKMITLSLPEIGRAHV